MFVKSAVRSFCSSDFFFLFWVDVIRGDEDELFELRESLWSKSSERQWNLFFNSFLLNKCLYGPRSNRLPFLHTIFLEKGTLFVYLRLTNGTPFKYLVYNFASLLTSVNALSFKKISKIERFVDFLKPYNSSVLLGLFTDPNDRFPYPFICLNWSNPYPFIYSIWSLRTVPLSGEASPYRPSKGVHPSGFEQVFTFSEIQIFTAFAWNSVTLAHLNPVERSTEINKTKQFVSCFFTHGHTLKYPFFACFKHWKNTETVTNTSHIGISFLF